MPMNVQAVSALRGVVHRDPKPLFSFRAEGVGRRQLGEASEAYLHTQLERGFRTLDFYKQMTLPAGPDR